MSAQTKQWLREITGHFLIVSQRLRSKPQKQPFAEFCEFSRSACFILSTVACCLLWMYSVCACVSPELLVATRGGTLGKLWGLWKATSSCRNLHQVSWEKRFLGKGGKKAFWGQNKSTPTKTWMFKFLYMRNTTGKLHNEIKIWTCLVYSADPILFLEIINLYIFCIKNTYWYKFIIKNKYPFVFFV